MKMWDMGYVNTIGYELDYRTLHSHEFDEISLIVQGDIKYISDSVSAHISGKSLIFSKAYQLHNPYVSQDKPYERYQICFSHGWLSDLIVTNNLSQMDSFIISLDDENFDVILQYMKLIYADTGKTDELSLLKRRFLLSALFAKITEVHHTSQHNYTQITKTYINEVLLYIEQNYSKKLTASDIASHFFVSRTKLMQDFKQQTGITLLNYINLIRIKFAKEFIKKGYSVTATAELCGFSNSGHFIKSFSVLNGITPLKYQKTYNMNLVDE